MTRQSIFSRACLTMILMGFPSLSWGFAHTSIYWVPSLSYPNPSSENEGGLSMMGFGMTLEPMVSQRSGIEFGVFYQPEVLNGYSNNSVTAPLVYRYWFTQNYTFSIGGFVTNQIDVLPRFVSPLNYGIRGTIGVNIKIFRGLDLAIEGGYLYGVANLSTISGPSFSKSQAFLAVGFRIGGIQTVTKVAANGFRYTLDRPPEYTEPVIVPKELLP